MAGFKQVAKLLGQVAEEGAPKAASLADELTGKVPKPSQAEQLAQAASEMIEPRPLDPQKLMQALEGKSNKKPHYSELPDPPEDAIIKVPKHLQHLYDSPEAYAAEKRKNQLMKLGITEPKPTQVPTAPTLPAEGGPATLSGSNKLFNPEMSGVVNYGAKKKANMLMPMAAAGDLFTDLRNSPLGDAATQWSKIKELVAGKAAKQMDLTGGKDPQFQKDATTVLGTALDPVNVIPGVGGLAAGGVEMLARDEETEKLKKKP